MTDPAPPGALHHGPLFPPSLRAALLSVVSFEALVILYMAAGVFKADPRFAWIPADPTVLFFALSVVVGAFILVMKSTGRHGLHVVFAGLALVVWFACSLHWSPSRIYGPDKVFFLSTLGVWALVAGAMIIAPDRDRLRRLFFILLLIAVPAGVEALVIYRESGGGRIYVGSTDYLGLGRLCSNGAIIVFVAWLFSRRRFGLLGLICLALFALFVIVLFIGGGRGPLLATAVGIVLPLALGLSAGRRGIRIARYQVPAFGLILLASVAVIVWIQTSEQTPETVKRMERIFDANDLSNVAGNRTEYYTLVPSLWAEAPVIGHGAGSWPLITGRGDIPRHPHNIIAEVTVEGGMIGLVLFLTLLAVSFRPISLARLRGDPLAMCALMLFTTAFLNAMVSADLAGNRLLFLLLGVMTMFALPQETPGPRWVSFLCPHRTPGPASRLAAAPQSGGQGAGMGPRDLLERT